MNKVKEGSVRRELSYKFGSIIIFSSGRAKFELGGGSEQMLDSYAASLVLRLVCRAELLADARDEAMNIALEKLGIPTEINADRDYALSFLHLAADFGRAGKTMKYVREFVLASHRMLSQAEADLASAYPDGGFGNLSLEIMNSLCDRASLDKVDSQPRRKLKKSAVEWIAAVAAAAMLPILL